MINDLLIDHFLRYFFFQLIFLLSVFKQIPTGTIYGNEMLIFFMKIKSPFKFMQILRNVYFNNQSEKYLHVFFFIGFITYNYDNFKQKKKQNKKIIKSIFILKIVAWRCHFKYLDRFSEMAFFYVFFSFYFYILIKEKKPLWFYNMAYGLMDLRWDLEFFFFLIVNYMNNEHITPCLLFYVRLSILKWYAEWFFYKYFTVAKKLTISQM